jgi:hypothetical protein
MARAPDPKPPPDDRVYGRAHTFEFACPKCHTMCWGGVRKRVARWDPSRCEITCVQCERIWIVGLSISEVQAGHKAKGRPWDQVPGANELDQLREAQEARRAEIRRRSYEGGTVNGKVTKVNGRAWKTNLQPECSCTYGSGVGGHIRTWINPECARHRERD